MTRLPRHELYSELCRDTLQYNQHQQHDSVCVGRRTATTAAVASSIVQFLSTTRESSTCTQLSFTFYLSVLTSRTLYNRSPPGWLLISLPFSASKPEFILTGLTHHLDCSLCLQSSFKFNEHLTFLTKYQFYPNVAILIYTYMNFAVFVLALTFFRSCCHQNP